MYYFTTLKLTRRWSSTSPRRLTNRELQKQLVAHPIALWRELLRWNLIRDASPYLSSKFADSPFDFYSKYLRSVPQQQPRWQRCVAWVDRDLGDAPGQVFVAKTFTPDTKDRVLKMT